MQLRMVSRRSLNGSMTVVGDIAQATGALAPNDWADVLRYLPEQKPSRVIGLSVGYRIPAQIMALANQVMIAATPTLRAPTSVRQSDEQPEFVSATSTRSAQRGRRRNPRADRPRSPTERSLSWHRTRWSKTSRRRSKLPASITLGQREPASSSGSPLFPSASSRASNWTASWWSSRPTIVEEEQQGLRALYVALTRSTRRLTIVHAEPLPAPMQQSDTPAPVL